MTTRPFLALAVGACALSLSAALAACTSSNAPTETLPDSGSSGGSSGGSSSGSGSSSSGSSSGAEDAGPTCFSGTPTTYLEIINACTDAAFVDKHPNLPLLLPDGGLPPLP